MPKDGWKRGQISQNWGGKDSSVIGGEHNQDITAKGGGAGRELRTNGAQSVRENKAVKGVFAFTSHVLHASESGSVHARLQTFPLYSNTASLGNAPALCRSQTSFFLFPVRAACDRIKL